jgi:hypothetical protein
MGQRDLKLVLRKWRKRRTRKQRLDRGRAVDAAPVENHGCGDLVGQTDFRAIAAPEMKRLFSQRPHRRRRLFLSQAEEAFLAAERKRRLRACRPIWRRQDGCRQSSHHCAPVRSKNAIGKMIRHGC